jgi:hypothetical protein
MSLSAGEQRTLSRIADQLAETDLKLASMFRVFNRLTSDEEMPARRRTSWSQQLEASHSRQTRGCARKRRLQGRTIKAVWPVLGACLIGAVLFTVAIALGHFGHGSDGRWRCPQSWPITCTRP